MRWRELGLWSLILMIHSSFQTAGSSLHAADSSFQTVDNSFQTADHTLQTGDSRGPGRRHRCVNMFLEHGMGRRVGQRVVFTCKVGYSLHGPAIGTSQDSHTSRFINFQPDLE
jgi:hypothetical protein